MLLAAIEHFEDAIAYKATEIGAKDTDYIFSYEDDKLPGGSILRHLYAWHTLVSSKQSCLDISTSDNVEAYHGEMQATLARITQSHDEPEQEPEGTPRRKSKRLS